jgi:hypothetical protein
MSRILILVSTPLILVGAAVWLRAASQRARGTAAVAPLALLLAVWGANTTEPQSGWANVLPLLGATLGAFAGAGLEAVKARVVSASAVSLGLGMFGFFVGMVAAIEIGWLRP